MNSKEQAASDNRSNQLNPNHEEYRGGQDDRKTEEDQNRDNRSNQLNPNNEEYKGE